MNKLKDDRRLFIAFVVTILLFVLGVYLKDASVAVYMMGAGGLVAMANASEKLPNPWSKTK